MSHSTGHGQQIGSEDTALSQESINTAMRSLMLEAQLDDTEDQIEDQTNEQIYLTDENLDLPGTTNDKLRKFMSLGSIISTSSSLARRNTEVMQGDKFREIGSGSQGIVFEIPGSLHCFKFKLIPHSPALWNNYRQQKKVKAAFDQAAKKGLKIGVRCPKAKAWISTEAPFWKVAVDRLEWPQNARDKKGKTHSGFAMERIFPVPEPFRHAIINAYCKGDKEAAVKDARNKDCLVRVYLGREEEDLPFSLRNFRMDVTKFEAGHLPADNYAIAMAGAMAVLHWEAKIDGNDVEFVLGSAPFFGSRVDLTLEEVDSQAPETDTFGLVYGDLQPNFKRRTMVLWVMDFDQCKDITLDQEGVEKAVEGMKKNNYCPRPGSGNQFQEGLWEIFSKRYLEVSKELLPQDSAHLADSFINGFKTMCAEKRRRQAEDAEADSTSAASQPPTPGSRNSRFGSPGRLPTRRADRTEQSWEYGDDARYQVGSPTGRGRGGSRNDGTGSPRGGSWTASRYRSAEPGRGRGSDLASTSWRGSLRGRSAPPWSLGRASDSNLRGSLGNRSNVGSGVGLDAWDRLGTSRRQAGGGQGSGASENDRNSHQQ